MKDDKHLLRYWDGTQDKIKSVSLTVDDIIESKLQLNMEDVGFILLRHQREQRGLPGPYDYVKTEDVIEQNARYKAALLRIADKITYQGKIATAALKE